MTQPPTIIAARIIPTVRAIEAELTSRYRDGVHILADVDLVNLALSLSGLTVTVACDDSDDVARIQPIEPKAHR